MPTRLTESRIPNNFAPADLGQFTTSADGHCTLISFITDPLVINRINSYVLFVTDSGTTSSAESYEWTVTLNTNAPQVFVTDEGELDYTPLDTGTLTISVRVLDGGNSELSTVDMSQSIVVRNAELETVISTATEESGPGVGNPDVARELINDYNPYYQSLTLATPEEGDGFKCFVFSTLNDRIQRQPITRRKQHIDQLASSLNGDIIDYAELSTEGAGVSGIRLALLAMSLGDTPPITWTELPEEAGARAAAERELNSQLNDLDENMRVDLFNLVRFPKSNIKMCAMILEKLRDRYFNGTDFESVMNGMSGTRAVWIMRHYNEGPILHE